MSIRLQDVLAYGGGECFQRFGTPFMRMTRAQDVAATIVRSGSVGSFVGKDGALRSASASRLRIDWIDTDGDGVMDTPTLLLEVGRTNLNDDDDLTAWSTGGSPVVTGSVSDPAGGTGAYTVEDDDGASGEYITRDVAITGGTGLTRCAVFVVKESPSDNTSVGNPISLTWFEAGVGQRMDLRVTSWSGGEPNVVASAGTFLGKRYLGDGWWALYGQTVSSLDSANTHSVRIRPTNNGADTNEVYVYRVNAFDEEVPSHSILDASETRNADTLNADFLHAPQALTLYAKWIERGTAFFAGAFPIIAEIGDGTDPGTLSIRRDNSSGDGRYECAVQADGSQTSVSEPNATVSWGDTVEFVAQLAADGAVTGIISINGAAAVSGSAGVAGGLPDSWTNSTVELGRGGITQIISCKVAAGVQTMADMRALFSYDSSRAVA